MIINKLLLKNYRNIGFLDLTLEKDINIFYGNNAQGKTNLLESIYFCATGHSQRTNNHKDLIKFGEEEAHLKLFTKESAESSYYEDKIDIHLKKDFKKGIAINSYSIKKISELFGVLLCVIFSPEDLSLVKAGPSERRKYIDMELCQISPIYCDAIKQYHHILKQRNNLLKNIKTKNESKSSLFVWDEQLVSYGVKIIEERRRFVEFISEFANEKHVNITLGSENLKIVYKPNVLENDFLDKLNKNIDRDLQTATTNIGVHKDDLQFLINGLDARIFASQGQQRTASISAKLAEIDLIKAIKDKAPVLLLDDVFSELDENRQIFLMKNIANTQSIITCTGIDEMIKKVENDYKVFKIVGGEVDERGIED